ncbi:MAG: hypothetical protein Kow002_11000 [Anaerolineales bacterium]
MPIELIPASKFSIQALVDLYNQTREDYLVPMPMNAQRLQEYIDDFDIDLSSSCVARSTEDGQVLGLGMLGVRQPLAWVTRLGVVPTTRRSGAGKAIIDYMLKRAEALGIQEIHLEVIKDNRPAHNLFLKKGFVDVDEYLVMRRTPQAVRKPLNGEVKWLNRDEALRILETYPKHLTWVTAHESMRNALHTEGLQIRFSNSDQGWLVYRYHQSLLSHLIMHTVHGDPAKVGTHLLRHLYSRYPQADTYAENIHAKDPHLPAFEALSFVIDFSRVEMRRKNKM